MKLIGKCGDCVILPVWFWMLETYKYPHIYSVKHCLKTCLWHARCCHAWHQNWDTLTTLASHFKNTSSSFLSFFMNGTWFRQRSRLVAFCNLIKVRLFCYVYTLLVCSISVLKDMQSLCVKQVLTVQMIKKFLILVLVYIICNYVTGNDLAAAYICI